MYQWKTPDQSSQIGSFIDELLGPARLETAAGATSLIRRLLEAAANEAVEAQCDVLTGYSLVKTASEQSRAIDELMRTEPIIYDAASWAIFDKYVKDIQKLESFLLDLGALPGKTGAALELDNVSACQGSIKIWEANRTRLHTQLQKLRGADAATQAWEQKRDDVAMFRMMVSKLEPVVPTTPPDSPMLKALEFLKSLLPMVDGDANPPHSDSVLHGIKAAWLMRGAIAEKDNATTTAGRKCYLGHEDVWNLGQSFAEKIAKEETATALVTAYEKFLDKLIRDESGVGDEELDPDLKTLMLDHPPLDRTGDVVVPDYRHPAWGGLAMVYRGLLKDEIQVAVKILKCRKDQYADADLEASNERRLRREMKVWAALQHRHIVEFLGYVSNLSDGRDLDYPAMISTWCHGGTAVEYLRTQGASVNKRIRLSQDVSDGLQYLHRLKVIHGDLKPGNVLVDEDGVAKLCDFGLVRLADWESPAGMTTTSAYTGSLRYKPPELFFSAGNRYPQASFEGDIYSLGSTLLEIHPFKRSRTNRELWNAIMDGYAPALRSETTGILLDMTDTFWDLLESCWSEKSLRPNVGTIVERLKNLSEKVDPSL